MAHDIFISYAEEDRQIADAVFHALEEAGGRCWYAPRDIPPGEDYEEVIVDAISESKMMVLILSSHSNNSAHVKREVQNACREEPPIPILPFQVENVRLNKALKYCIGSVQLLNAVTPPLETHLQKLVKYVQARLLQHEQEQTEKQHSQEAEPEVAAGAEEAEHRRAPEKRPMLEGVDAAKRQAVEAPYQKMARWLRISDGTFLGILLVLSSFLTLAIYILLYTDRAPQQTLNANAVSQTTGQANNATKAPETAQENITRGDAFYRQGKYAEAEPYYREAVRLEPNNANYHNNLGNDLYRLKKYAEAEVSYREAARLQPDSAVHYFNLGRALFQREKYTMAEQAYRESLRLEPLDADALNDLGAALYWQNKFAEAETRYREAMRLSPNNALYHFNLGYALSRQQRHVEAATQFREAARLDPDNAEYQQKLKEVTSGPAGNRNM